MTAQQKKARERAEYDHLMRCRKVGCLKCAGRTLSVRPA